MSGKTAGRNTSNRKFATSSTVKRAEPAKRSRTTTAKKSVAAKSAAVKSSRSAPAKLSARATANVPAKRSAAKKATATDKYTDPALRERIKAKVVREGKGGRPGQWSARKAQIVAHEYEAEGGKYKGSRDETQKSLTAWGDEHWQTSDGKPAQRKDGMHRYLPQKAWATLSEAEKRSTEKKKLAGDHAGKQFVANTGAAVKARRKAEK